MLIVGLCLAWILAWVIIGAVTTRICDHFMHFGPDDAYDGTLVMITMGWPIVWAAVAMFLMGWPIYKIAQFIINCGKPKTQPEPIPHVETEEEIRAKKEWEEEVVQKIPIAM